MLFRSGQQQAQSGQISDLASSFLNQLSKLGSSQTSAMSGLKSDIADQIAAAQQQSQQGDLLNMLMMAGMMDQQQQQAVPEQQLMNLAGLRSVSDIFGQQPTSLADLLRRRA